jgi:hypothetical protein
MCKVTAKNLQDYLLSNYSKELTRLQLSKIDAEGYDKEILKTIPSILQQYKPKLMIECCKNLSTEERYELFDIVIQHGYHIFYLENFEADGKQLKIERKHMTNKKHFEMLAIHASTPY